MVNLLKEPQWFFGIDGKNLPQWFWGYDSYLQLAFFIITLIIGIYAFKIYKLSRKKGSRHLAVGFFLMSLSYLVWSILNLAIIKNLGEKLCEGIHICEINLLVDISIYIHMLLFLIGLLTLVYSTLKLKSIRMYFLFFVVLILVIIFSKKTLFFFYLLSSVLLLYLFIHQITNYIRKKRLKLLLMTIAFGLLFLGSTVFLIGLYKGIYYVGGNLFVLAAYIIILIDVVLALKK